MKIVLTFVLLISLWQYGHTQLTIDPGGFITVNSSGSLYVGTSLNINSNSMGSGYLVDQTSGNKIDITGNISIERYIQSNGWHNISIPIVSANSSLFSTTDLVFYYDETKIYNDWNFGWVWYNGTLSTMKGYDVYLDASAITVDYSAPNSSSLNTGSYNIGVTLTDVADGETENHKGWNLIGNPYPSPIDWLVESGWDKTDINDAKYIWNPATDNYTIFLGGSSPVGINGGTQYIPSNQGFWVQAIANGNVSVNNSARIGDISSTPDYYKNSVSDYPFISLEVKGNSLSDETMIRFIKSASNKFDHNYDATKLYSRSLLIPQISTSFGSVDFSINTLPEIFDGIEIPLNFTCKTAANYCLELDDRSRLNSTIVVYLFDRLEKKSINLSLEKKYWFSHNIYNAEQRFIIIMNPTEDDLKSLKLDQPFLIYSNNSTVYITNLKGKNLNIKVEIINLFGQIIFTDTYNQQKINLKVESNSGYYIARIISEEGEFNTKLFIQHE